MNHLNKLFSTLKKEMAQMTAKIEWTQQIFSKSINQEEKNAFTLIEHQERVYDGGCFLLSAFCVTFA